jgi:hypothetical protein
MPIFFFHIHDGSSLAEDPDGTDLPNLELAYAEAVAMVRELAADDLRVNKPARNLNIEITDASLIPSFRAGSFRHEHAGL